MTSIQPFINRKIVVLHQDEPVKNAAHVMRDRGIGCVMVSDHEGHIVGIATDRDLVTHVIAGPGDKLTPLSQVMTPRPVFVDESSDVENIIRLMEEHGVRRVPVIRKLSGGMQKCVGLVSLDDLVASRLIDYPHLTRIVRSQILRRIGPATLGPGPRFLGMSDVESSRGDKQALTAFHKLIATRIGDKAGLTPEQTAQAVKIVLSSLLSRLHYTGSLHLLLQLPRALRDELLDLPPGPDHSMSAARITSNLRKHFDFDEATAYLVASRICNSVEECGNPRELEHVKLQLPDDLRALFSTAEHAEFKRKAG